MGWFRKAKPERRFWCPDCERIMVKSDGVRADAHGGYFHMLWKSKEIQGVDFGNWLYHTKLLYEEDDSPSRMKVEKTQPDGRLSVVDSGTLSLVEGE